MGKFGKRRKPKFLENTDFVPESHGAHESPIQIVSLGDHGDDHAMIVIRTEGGEEIELRFDYDGNGMLTAHHDDHEYSIPVEIEVVSDDEGHEESHEEEEEHKALPTFESFVNECWTPMQEGYNPAMSEDAKRAIKAICEDMLIKEAQMCDEDHDAMHTYENYLAECGQWMTECMMEAATKVEVNESSAYYCDTCGERAEHEEIEDNPRMKCSNCGDSNWNQDY